MTVLPIAIVGFGKIACDQHGPAIAADPRFALAAVVDPTIEESPVPIYRSLENLLAERSDVAALAMCQPPRFRASATRLALAAGRHVLLEKPPAGDPGEVAALEAVADGAGVTLFAAWHSREAAAVASTREWLAGQTILSVAIIWKEDVRFWHPGQEWLWQQGGFGVFDPGINALSILTALVPGRIEFRSAQLERPSNRAAPIAARLKMASACGAPITAEFDFRQSGEQTWDIVVEAGGGRLVLSRGGNAWSIDGVPRPTPCEAEYSRLYTRFAELIENGDSEVDFEPLRLVCEALSCGSESEVAPFEY